MKVEDKARPQTKGIARLLGAGGGMGGWGLESFSLFPAACTQDWEHAASGPACTL